VRSVVVIGRASWEGKFIVSALEELGWPVIARFVVAPSVDVVEGAMPALDTAHVAAVIATDSIIGSQAGAVERFVRSGGGLILAGPSSMSPSLRAIAPGLLGARTHPAMQPTDTISLGSTGFYPVASLGTGAVPVDRRPAGIALAARRVGAGRVLQVGYDDTWRWRMAGAPGSERAHREWWSRLVGSVAYVPSEAPRSDSSSAAPLARLVGRLGPAISRPVAPVSRGPVDPRILIAIIMTLLIIEWGSRRLRGLR
jgi:hypothetical protein